MTSAWLLPEHMADVLPSQARRIEELRRGVLDTAARYGYELVMPPLLEYLDSLLSGTGRELNLRTFKLVDQLSGRSLGLRADTTPQVARIDAHLLNRDGVTRLCYCGPVAHARPSGLQSSREPLQFGAELYGHAGLEADLEVQDLALDSLRAVGLSGLVLDMADARIVRGLLHGLSIDAGRLDELYRALSAKDALALADVTHGYPDEVRRGLHSLLALYGDAEVLEAAAAALPARPQVSAALDDLKRLAAHATVAHPQVTVGFDLSDFSGQTYYSGARFAVYAEGCEQALLRGGRYDEIGAVFGRTRPAAGFSGDLKALASMGAGVMPRKAVQAPWSEDAALREVVRELRGAGHTVVCLLPGHEHEGDEVDCDRRIEWLGGRWQLREVTARAAP
ncbi:MAG TPA: ATP phosphoribosyltransferase regulatory subunit [Methylibium sp.]|uniref:ATP phosphoribosyltransferase regulatory subunit n=1 Tax=Methylibium sp. TaxID=2067992 RepID=UPI002DB9DC35|nr:ATP phosphoribosyltransferase regulatory subunit [Methylibium sp.]HEU4460220.1 ATP phosphoribosyltransferase regulatory subunit [Methylibium sp.]